MTPIAFKSLGCLGEGHTLNFVPGDWAYFMPPEWNSGASRFCPVCLSVCDSMAKNFNLGHNF